MKFAAVNLGCKVNHVELEEFASRLLAGGAQAVDAADADVIIVNTCTVTGEAERKTRKAVNRALAANDSATVLLTGCSVAVNPSYYEALNPRVKVVSKADMPEYLGNLAAEASPYAHETAAGGASSIFRTRTGVKVQDGCDNACTFCIVHTARGKATSVPRDEILRNTEALLESGANEIVLTGINLGSFRDDRGGLASLLEDLLASADRLNPAARFRLSSIEPTDIDDDLIALMAREGGRVCRHLHIPLQSGCTKVLSEMNRRYTADEYAALVARLRAVVPSISLTTDIIVGFPGETDAEFEETLAFVRACGFSKIHVFPYSIRANTLAANRTDQIAPAVKQERARRLRELSDELRAADYTARVGTAELVLVEGKGSGMTESYHKVPVTGPARTGDLISLAIPVLE